MVIPVDIAARDDKGVEYVAACDGLYVALLAVERPSEHGGAELLEGVRGASEEVKGAEGGDLAVDLDGGRPWERWTM